MSIRCQFGWHDHGVTSHQIGQPTTFGMYCRRCGRHWTDIFWLPQQPISCSHPAEYRIDLRPPVLVDTPKGPQYQRLTDCAICRTLRRVQ